MASPVIDLSAKITTTSSSFSATPDYDFVVPGNKFFMPEEISFAADGNFQNVGRVEVYVRGELITTSAGAASSGGIPLIQNFTVSFKKDNVLVLMGVQEHITVKVRNTDGSTAVTVQVSVTGYYLDRIEAESVVRRTLDQGILVSGGAGLL